MCTGPRRPLFEHANPAPYRLHHLLQHSSSFLCRHDGLLAGSRQGGVVRSVRLRTGPREAGVLGLPDDEPPSRSQATDELTDDRVTETDIAPEPDVEPEPEKSAARRFPSLHPP